ncbi:SipW-dependent-type signal peptide-containing protein [Haloglomus litoreum]|uniref:SipW-dependent-type signal peptide-containing protein n=1 Tax=Haloglomus litoreum TaxID=3034026 RepID=UPI0023E79630|nr:SipW-dependent-type signal peptide-containing protein [Haloglomus sp. DT116]
MTEHIDITRRKVLAAAGAVGVTGLGAGLGTSALFNDTESFARNTLAAGDLDLRVDWQQTYSGPHPGTGDVGTHAVNAYPDHDGDGLQSFNEVQYGGPGATASADEIPGVCCDCDADEFLLVQGGETYCIDAVEDTVPIEDYYDYEGSVFASQRDAIQDPNTSSVFVYRNVDTGNVSLVVVHGSRSGGGDGGAASFDYYGLDSGASWLVTDDPPSGRDSYSVDPGFSNHLWDAGYTDGGAVGPLSDGFCVTVVPAFNEAAELYGTEGIDGTVDEWRAFDGHPDNTVDLLDGTDPVNASPITICSGCSVRSGSNLDVPEVFRSEAYPEQDHLIELSDVKPGDTGEITFSLHNCHNPAYLWLDVLNLTGAENGMTEPESTVDSDGNSELPDAVEVRFWYDRDCDNALDDGERLIYPASGYATVADLFESAGEPIDGGRRIELDGQPYDDGSRELPGDGGTLCIGFEWRVPTGVGNEIQSDSLGFDLRYYTEQSRNQ